LHLIATLTDEIQAYDQRIEKLASEKYVHTKLLRQVTGVGPVTELAYVLTLETPLRFAKSRDVGPYLGLVPQQEDSGDSQPQLGISKAGDKMLRKLLVGSAHYILGPFGPDTDLRRFGMKLCQRAERTPRNGRPSPWRETLPFYCIGFGRAAKSIKPWATECQRP
jgi:transposase